MRRNIFIFVLSLILPALLGAQATPGSHRVSQVFTRSATGVTAQIVPNAQVTVTNTATGQPAVIYSDPSLTSRINPPSITTDSNGNYDYYAPLNVCLTESISAPGQGVKVTPNICSNGSGTPYPPAGIAVSTSVAWGSSITRPVGDLVGTTDTQTLTNKTVDGVAPATFGFLDPTSSIQTQLNNKASSTITVQGHPLSGNVVISASDLTTGTLPHPQLPPLVSGDIPDNAANTSGTSSGFSGVPDITVGAITASGAFNLSNTSTLLSLGTGNVSQNFNSNTETFTASYWNGSVAVPATMQQFLWIGTGTNPVVLEDHYFPAGLNTATVLYATNQANLATSGANISTPKFKLRGAYWNGSISNLEDWDVQGVVGTGTNPTDTLTFTHTGSTGAAVVSVPSLKTTGGTPGIQLTAAAFSTYPTCVAGTEGLEEAVNDSTTNTWGATVTGGGANHIKMYCDSSAWTVEAK